MCPTTSHASVYGSKKVQSTRGGIDAAFQYTPPVLKEYEYCWYIEFYAYDPAEGRMRRKRIKVNRFKNIKKRREYVRDVIKRIGTQLSRGWNPWIAKDTEDLYIFEEALTRYEAYIEKMLANGYFRKETYEGYKSYIKILREYIKTKSPLYYVYQFDRHFCADFLDYVFIERNNGAQTRNNYLNFLRVFSGFLVDKGYLKSRPTDGIAPISKRLFSKERTCIPLDVVGKIADYCKERDPYFLFACYLLYYSFIRPVEMTRLKVRYFNLKDGTIILPADITKNRKTQTITLPKKVLAYGLELGVFSAPMDDFIFSLKLRPGTEEIDPKLFRDHWEKLRKALGLRREWKFYSLKDTGITQMLKTDGIKSIEVRDQARHSSLAVTEIYTGHTDKVNPTIYELDGVL